MRSGLVARLLVLATAALLALSVSALAAFVDLPSNGAQVNDDAANGIDPAQDAGLSDVTGGSLAAGALEVPWGVFEQKTGASSQGIFVRAFKGGAWVTQGSPASLNIDAAAVASAPAIDFAGTGRTVPWVTWSEPNNIGGATAKVFASRFAANAGAPGGGVWTPEGQDRDPGTAAVPALNINLDRTAENPGVTGGATQAGADPVPWIAWQEHDGGPSDVNSTPNVFVARGVKQAASGQACPAGTKPSGGNSVGVFCWQQVGSDRLAKTGGSSPTGDPTLSIDPTRDGVEPVIAFTGPNDSVVWVLWYEENPSGALNLRDNQQVFAAKAVADAASDGGFKWQAVGNGTAGQTNFLDTSGATNHFGNCSESTTAEDACSLNKVATDDAENVRVAAGTITPGAATVPWAVWDEIVSPGKHAIFISRLVGGDHFELFNGGNPLSNPADDAIRPDIAFSGNVPYVSWQEEVSPGVVKAFYGHFEGTAFKLDAPGGVSVSPGGVVPDLRAPISSSCTADPFSGDGGACQGGAVGTPFFLFADGTGPQKLFGRAYHPSDIATGAASSVGTTAAVLNGAVNPGGAAVRAHFEFGPTTSYGNVTPDQRLGASSAPQPFTASLTGLTPNTTYHFRAVVQSDFGVLLGADQVLTSSAIPATGTRRRPDSNISRFPHVLRARRLKRFRGTASSSAGIREVDIALERLSGGARATRAVCRALRGNGKLRKVKLRRGRCRTRVFLKARGTTRWTFRLRRRLPRGAYVLYARAVDRTGLRETSFSARDRNRVRFRLT